MAAHVKEVVIDRGSYGDDASALAALQAAVDAGGNVLVSGTFALGDGDSVRVGRHGNDVTIKPKGQASLVGGSNSVLQLGGRMTLKDLGIRNSHDTYVKVSAASGVEIHGCTFSGLQVDENASMKAGIAVVGLTGPSPTEVLIKSNRIDGGNTLPQANIPTRGIFVESPYVNAKIHDNDITQCGAAGIFVRQSGGTFAVQKNRIVGEGKKPDFYGAGVWLWSAGLAPSEFHIRDNDIRSRGSFLTVGYGNFAPLAAPVDFVVSHNDIDVESECSVLLMHGNVDSTVWKHNTVRGSAPNVIGIFGAESVGGAESNVFDHNTLSVELTEAPP